jgi:nitrosocyanin
MRNLLLSALLLLCTSTAHAATQEIRVVAIENGGVKFWLPATIVVHKGDTVKLNLENKIMDKAGNVHGFEIPEYKVMEVVEAGKPKTVTFTADKAGIFTMKCQLHPAHMGGQLVVLE